MNKNLLTRLLMTSFLVVMLLALSFGPVSKVAAVASGDQKQQDFIPGQLIVGVTMDKGKPALNINDLASKVGATILETALDQSFYLLKFPSDAAAAKSINILKRLSGVKYVERNGILRIPPITLTLAPKSGANVPALSAQSWSPVDSLNSYQWHLDKILYYQTATPEMNRPCVVVIDTGVDYTHPDLSGKVYLGVDYFDSDMDPMDMNGQGTHVAGIIGARTNNGLGISGVAPYSNILAVRVLGPDGWGTFWMVAQGILWANIYGENHCGGQIPKVYNLNLGGSYSSMVHTAIVGAYALDRLVVTPAGNGNTSSTTYANPGADPNAFGVAATEETDHRAYFSNYDTVDIPWVDIAAPGYNILSTVPGGYAYYRSMATPVVAGVAARIWSKYPALSLESVKTRLITTADPTLGFPRAIGRVDLARALDYTGRTLQGQVFDSANIVPLANADVFVSFGGTTVCHVVSKGDGFYTCPNLASAGVYAIQVTKAGRPVTGTSTSVATFTFNANVFMSTNLGSSTSNDWTITTQWPSWQPFDTGPGQGMETDLWLVDSTASPAVCYNANYLPNDTDPWNIMLPRDSYLIGHSEAAWIKHTMASYGHNLDVWVSVYDDYYWPDTTRITGSGLAVKVYKNNVAYGAWVAPGTPTTADSDDWFVGTINFSTNTFTLVNQIKTDAQVPTCVYP